jgi:tetratricopeptide (TPR) repeat protein
MLDTMMDLLGTYYNLSAWDHLLKTAAEALPLAHQVGDRFRVTTIEYIQGMAAYCLGDFGASKQLMEGALAEYEATNHLRQVGLALNMLGLIADAAGNYAKAEALLRQALDGAVERKTILEAAYAEHDLGALLIELDRPLEAIPLLQQASAAWQEQANLLLLVKSQTYLGLALLYAGERAQAVELAAEGLKTFRSGIPFGEMAQAWLWVLYRLTKALGDETSALSVLHAANDELERQARSISDNESRRRFFENVPLNRQIVAAHDVLTGTVRTKLADLARRDAPLGRSLRPDEVVAVHWTVYGPEDNAIADKTGRRRYRLERLMRQAEAYGAAPTDADLAEALGVSRRTILRDMQEIALDRSTPPTRKRIQAKGKNPLPA